MGMTMDPLLPTDVLSTETKRPGNTKRLGNTKAGKTTQLAEASS